MTGIKRVEDVIERLAGIATVDYGFLQGRKAILSQLQKRTGEDEETRVDMCIANAKNAVESLISKSSPYTIPEDYLYFLGYYGGLCISRDSHYFQVFGIGPMVEEWYAAIDSDAAILKPGESGFLSIGSLSFATGKFQFQRVNFFLDLAGVVQKQSIIGIGPWSKEETTPLDVIKDFSAYAGMWKIIAGTFIEWLGQVAKTQGLFIYT